MKRYDKYKESGISWIGDIPEHWEVKRLKSRLSLVKDRGTNSIKVGLENIESFTGRFFPSESLFDGDGIQVHIGDIVYGKLRPYLGKVWLASFECSAIGDFYVFRCGSDCDKRFMSYLFLSAPFTGVCNASTYGAKMPRASSNFMLSLPISLPPLSEQEMIVAYLEKKVAQMDNLVAKQEAQIAYLRELKQAIITKAVTQGLDPQAPLRPSGIPWIGDIPEHWEVRMLSQLSQEYFVSNKDIKHQNYYYDKSIADGYTLKIIREDIETSYKERLSDVYDKLETLVQKKDVRKSEIIEHPSYVNELVRYIITDLKEFRKIQGDETLGGMVICETSEQARRLYDVFQEEWHKYQPKLIKIKLPDGSCVVGEPVADYKSKYRSLKAGIILHDTDDKEKTIAQHLRVSAQIFPTRYSEHLGRVECLIYLPFLPL